MPGIDDKKRLRLLPEVLPAPSPPSGEEPPRQRALQTMHRLMALATAGAALQPGCSSGSSAPEIHRDQAPATSSVAVTPSAAPSASELAVTPSAAPPASESAGVARNPPPIPSASGAPSASVAAQPSAHAPLLGSKGVRPVKPPIGYGVVDPMPNPVRIPPKNGGKVP